MAKKDETPPDEGEKAPTEVEPGSLNEKAPAIDPDIPETDPEDLGGEGDDDGVEDILDVVIPLNHAKELVDTLRERGYVSLADAMLAVEAGESITIRVEAV